MYLLFRLPSQQAPHLPQNPLLRSSEDLAAQRFTRVASHGGCHSRAATRQAHEILAELLSHKVRIRLVCSDECPALLVILFVILAVGIDVASLDKRFGVFEVAVDALDGGVDTVFLYLLTTATPEVGPSSHCESPRLVCEP